MTTVVAAGAPVPDARTREPAARRTRLPYAVATAWYAVFIARSSFTVRGRRTFALFDDAMISMTYARNLARGHGLVWKDVDRCLDSPALELGSQRGKVHHLGAAEQYQLAAVAQAGQFWRTDQAAILDGRCG